MRRVREALAALRERLATTSASPDLDAAILVAEALGVSRAALEADPDRRSRPPRPRGSRRSLPGARRANRSPT